MGQLQGLGLPLGDVMFPAGKIKMRVWVGLGRLQMFSSPEVLSPWSPFSVPPPHCLSPAANEQLSEASMLTKQRRLGRRLGRGEEGQVILFLESEAPPNSHHRSSAPLPSPPASRESSVCPTHLP